MRKYSFFGFFLCLLLISLQIPIHISSQVPSVPLRDERSYYGYHFGLAGVIDAMIKNHRFIDNNTITELTELLWESRYSDENGSKSIWYRSSEELSFWTGNKYGSTGIIEAFINYYKFSNDSIWLHRAESVMNQIIKQANLVDNSVKWSYTFGDPDFAIGISVTGHQFGSASILKQINNLYELTDNTTYLHLGRNIINWYNSLIEEYNYIPWYSESGFGSFIIYSYGRGLSGIIPTLLQFANLDNNSLAFDIAISSIETIINDQNDDGSWPIQSNSEIIHLDGLDGVASVVNGLNEILDYEINDTIKADITISIKKASDYILNQYSEIQNYIYLKDPGKGDRLHLGAATGQLGILNSIKSIEHLLVGNEKDLVKSLFESFIDRSIIEVKVDNKNYVLPKFFFDNMLFFDMSFADGIAGYLMYLPNFKDNFSDEIEKILLDLIKSFELFQTNQGLYSKQINSDETWSLPEPVGTDSGFLNIFGAFPITLLILLPLILLITNRRR
jgi:hypothetical protein